MNGLAQVDAWNHALAQARLDLRAELMEVYSGGDVLEVLQNLAESDPQFDVEISEVKKAVCAARQRNAGPDEIGRLHCKLGAILDRWLEHGIEQYISGEEEDRALEYLSKKVR